LTCSNFFFTYANVKHFQVFNFVRCCQSAFLFQCVKAIICFVLLRNHNNLFFLHLCHHQNMVFLFNPNLLLSFSLFIFQFFIYIYIKSLLFVEVFYIFPFMCRCLLIVFCCFVFFSSWTSFIFSICKIVVIFLFAYSISFLFSPCLFFLFQCSIMINQLPRSLIMNLFKKLLMKLSMNLHLTLMLMQLLDLNLKFWFCYNMHTFSL